MAVDLRMMGTWPLPQRISTVASALLLVLYLLRPDGLFFLGSVLFGLVGLGPTALTSLRLSRQELALTFREQSEEVRVAIDEKADEAEGATVEPPVPADRDGDQRPKVSGKDAEVLRRVADALDAAMPSTPAEFASAFAQAVAAVVSQPSLLRGRTDELGGDVTITEPVAGAFSASEQLIIHIDEPGVSFSRPPWAIVSQSDLKLSAGSVGATNVSALLSDDRRQASWRLWSASTTPAVITIRALFFEVSDEAAYGPLNIIVRIGDTTRRLTTGIVAPTPPNSSGNITGH
jgi:hypothetical protein